MEESGSEAQRKAAMRRGERGWKRSVSRYMHLAQLYVTAEVNALRAGGVTACQNSLLIICHPSDHILTQLHVELHCTTQGEQAHVQTQRPAINITEPDKQLLRHCSTHTAVS